MNLKLSQILAKNTYYDQETEVPVKGHYSAKVEIQNGNVSYAEVTKKIKEPEKENG